MKLVSEVQITPVKPVNGLVGFASFVLYESLYCGSVGIYTRPEGGYRLTYPMRKVSGMNLDIYHPITRILGKAIEDVVIEKYEDVVSTKDGRYGCIES